MIFVEGLTLPIFHEDRLTQAVQEGHFIDVRPGVVNENAGLHVACGIDVAVVFPPRHAAADELAVILEVNGKELLAALQPTDLPDPILHIQPLLRRQ